MSAADGMRNLRHYANEYVRHLNATGHLNSGEWRYEDATIALGVVGGRGTIRVNFKSHCRSDVVELPYIALDKIGVMEAVFETQRDKITSLKALSRNADAVQ